MNIHYFYLKNSIQLHIGCLEYLPAPSLHIYKQAM